MRQHAAAWQQCHRRLYRTCNLALKGPQLCRMFQHPARHSSHKRYNLVQASAVQELLAGTFVAASAAGLLYSAVPLLTGQAKEKNQNQTDKYRDKDADPGDIKWGVMSVISFIPLVNWTAWVFAAIDDEDSAAKYYAYSAIYAIPLLRSGFSFDSFLIAAVLLCAAHVQVERIANTEPVSVAVPGISDATKAAGQQARQLRDSAREWQASVQETSDRRKSEKEAVETQNTEEYRKRLSDDELSQWDRRFKSKDRQDG